MTAYLLQCNILVYCRICGLIDSVDTNFVNVPTQIVFRVWCFIVFSTKPVIGYVVLHDIPVIQKISSEDYTEYLNKRL